MKNEFDDFLEEVRNGKEGNSTWLPIGFKKIGQHVGTGKKIYTVIGGFPGSGKTAYVDLAYVINPYNWWLKNRDNTDVKVRWIYRSMERNKSHKIGKWVSIRLWRKYRVLLDVPTIFGWGSSKHKVSQELYDIICECRDYIEEMMDYVEIIDGPENPTGIYKHVVEYAKHHGKMVKEEYRMKDGKIGNRSKYVPNDPNLITQIIEDHIGKCKGEEIGSKWEKGKKVIRGRFAGTGSKELLDKMSEYNSSEFRDKFGFSPVAVMQFNRNLESSARSAQFSKNDISLGPLPTDFKGTGNAYEDADVVQALYNPYKVNDMDHMGYNIPKFVNKGGYNRFRSVTVLKNSYGIDDVCYGLNFLGENGDIRELPKADEIQDYSTYTDIPTNNDEYLPI